MIKISKKVFMGMLGTSLLLYGCASGETEEADSQEEAELQVMTTFYPMYEFTSQIAGERADVGLIVGSGEDAHGYEPSAQDVAMVNDSDVFVYSSEDMEYWVNNLLETIENDELVIARAADGVEDTYETHDHNHSHEDEEGGQHEHSHDHSDDHSHESEADHSEIQLEGIQGHYHSGDTVTIEASSELDGSFVWEIREDGEEFETVEEDSSQFEYQLEDSSVDLQVSLVAEDGEELSAVTETLVIDDHEGEEDPHIWLDLVSAQDQVDIIADALVAADPGGEEVYLENAESFKNEIEQLHTEYEETFSDVENNTFVVQHQAFGYLADRYDLNQVAVGGLSTEVEPSPSRMAEVGSIVEEYDVPVIYYQEGANSSIAQTIASETNTETAVLHDLETLSEELQEQDLGYIEAMEENLESLKLSIN